MNSLKKFNELRAELLTYCADNTYSEKLKHYVFDSLNDIGIDVRSYTFTHGELVLKTIVDGSNIMLHLPCKCMIVVRNRETQEITKSFDITDVNTAYIEDLEASMSRNIDALKYEVVVI